MEVLCGRDIKDYDHSDFSGGSAGDGGSYKNDDVDGMTKKLSGKDKRQRLLPDFRFLVAQIDTFLFIFSSFLSIFPPFTNFFRLYGFVDQFQCGYW